MNCNDLASREECEAFIPIYHVYVFLLEKIRHYTHFAYLYIHAYFHFGYASVGARPKGLVPGPQPHEEVGGAFDSVFFVLLGRKVEKF